jgi:hypothetical protein
MKLKRNRYLSAAADGGAGAAQEAAEANPADAQGTAKPEDNAGQQGEAKADKNTEAPAQPEKPPINMDDIEEHVSKKVAEELKKSQMSDEERKTYELEQKQQQLDDREKEISVRELKANAGKLLTKIGLSADIADIVLGADMKETAKNIEAFKACLDAEVQKQVAERLKGKTPMGGSGEADSASTVQADFKKATSVYNSVDELPEWAKETVKKLVDKGYLQGSGSGLNLGDDMLRTLVILDRAGNF